ncbi:short-chain dehydrogenase/reductase-like protein SDR [Lentithecium fluviatile CBS 122367]|uniref:Short-chain dehydrogenase/reductase-like protein SDR n=1 Tax=Lentithecium fluviatile CBS 122367 TaxID=1168545 RepID=A0A6G1JMF3_9PLEO|nr:short-chain dehydrogenase/reductase-like protein SDR [Lentithecium fluviatile CBS 122367]
MPPYSLPKDAVWFITGCSSGIGHALCMHLSTKTHSRIAATARNPSSLASLPSSPNILKLALDVTSDFSVQEALSATVKEFSRIDVVVNSAGYGAMGDTETMDMAKARGMMETNFWGAVRVTRLVLPILREENGRAGMMKGGLIMQITSMGGRVAFAGNTFYHASKFALEGFTEGLARELPEEWAVRFLCVEPGGVKTGYSETATKGFDGEKRLEVYKDPRLPTNMMLRYKETAEATKGWAEPGKVAEVLYEYLRDGGMGGEMGLRLPLGSDSWGMQKHALEEGLVELERAREVSCKTSGMEQLESIGFLKK